MKPDQAYQELVARSKEVTYLSSCIGLLHWDQRTQMPPKGHAARTSQLVTLASIRHRKISDPVIGDLLEAVESSPLTRDPGSIEAVNVREWRRQYDRTTKIPEDLAKELVRAASEGQAAWEKARPARDWQLFKPYLERIVVLKKEEAEALGYEDEPYDAMLDTYEEGACTKEIEPLFRQMAQALQELLCRILGSSNRPKPFLNGLRFPVDRQVEFATLVARRLGYDLDAGRVDTSAHPFTSGIGPGDVRITSRYNEEDLCEGFFAVIHEAGHAMYHQGLPLEHWGLPFCSPVSLGIHESQSRMWENMVARSRAFWEHFFPMALEFFPALDSIELDRFHASINRVEPSLIRVDADEVTYNLHVLVRFELETALMRGELEVEDLPDAWNRSMSEHLGVVPDNVSDGVMQDTHWAGGAIGYFPTYTLGNIYAAQFFARAEKDLGDLKALFAAGDFVPLRRWLHDRIHSQGSRYRPGELVRKVTGEDPDARYLVRYLEAKYSRLYKL